jgi:hypothetical protein
MAKVSVSGGLTTVRSHIPAAPVINIFIIRYRLSFFANFIIIIIITISNNNNKPFESGSSRIFSYGALGPHFKLFVTAGGHDHVLCRVVDEARNIAIYFYYYHDNYLLQKVYISWGESAHVFKTNRETATS